MDKAKKELLKRYRKAMRKVDRETDIINAARERKYYWQKKAKILKEDIKLANEGHLEMPF